MKKIDTTIKMDIGGFLVFYFEAGKLSKIIQKVLEIARKITWSLGI